MKPRSFLSRGAVDSRRMDAFSGAALAVAPLLLAFIVVSSSSGGRCHALGTGRSLLTTHSDLAHKACSLALKSEEKLSTNGRAPGGLAESVVQGRWTYQQTSSGVRKHASLPSDSGQVFISYRQWEPVRLLQAHPYPSRATPVLPLSSLLPILLRIRSVRSVVLVLF